MFDFFGPEFDDTESNCCLIEKKHNHQFICKKTDCSDCEPLRRLDVYCKGEVMYLERSKQSNVRLFLKPDVEVMDALVGVWMLRPDTDATDMLF
mmetsp:Transcript_975/g.1119  ORF Transcript_975/g.1119 Transcript_975/m.1119 type:complete len:94 (+) Transcript_975:111-392(+)